MSKAWRIVIYVLTSVFVVGLILSACFNWVTINTDIKFYRDATVSISVFSIGLFAVLFQINTKDIYGHSLKQESHFEIIYLKRQIRSVKNDDMQCKRRLPNRMLVPYIVYAIAIPFSTGLCVITQKTENAPPTELYTICVYISYFLLITVVAITVVYMVYVLRVMYSYDWIENYARKICKKVAKLKDPEAFTKGIVIAADSLRILASDDNSSARDICKIHDDIMQKRLDMAATDELDYDDAKPFMVYFSSLVEACCVSGAGKLKGYNNLPINEDVEINGELSSDNLSLISAWLNKLQDSNTMTNDLWPILLLFVRKEIRIIVSSITNIDHNGIKSRDYLIFSDRIHACLINRYFFREIDVLSHLTQRYVEDVVSDIVFSDEHKLNHFNALCYLADDFFASLCSEQMLAQAMEVNNENYD